MKFIPNIINSLPAITICYNKLYSFEKLVKLYPEYKDSFEEYLDFTNQNENNYGIDGEIGKIILSKNNIYNSLYRYIIESNGLNSIEMFYYTNLNIQDIFDNLTLPFENNIIFPNFKNNRIPKNDKPYIESITSLLKPIESVDLYKKFKCFTFFDEKQIQLSKNKVSLEYIRIIVEFPKTWFPFDSKNGISIAVHSPNVIPERDSFIVLEPQDAIFNIYYSKVEDFRLENYENCVDRGDIVHDHDTRQYCLLECMTNKINSDCFKGFFSIRTHLLRKDQLPRSNSGNSKHCSNSTKMNEYLRTCHVVCKEDCYQAHYFVNIEEEKSDFQPNQTSSFNKSIKLKLKSNSRPNILIKHFVEITFVSLFCNFGGLIGMYLGVSLQSVCIDVWEMSKRLFIKFIWVKIINLKSNNQHNTNIHFNRPIILISNEGNRSRHMIQRN